jgi:hypothetical protein
LEFCFNVWRNKQFVDPKKALLESIFVLAFFEFLHVLEFVPKSFLDPQGHFLAWVMGLPP